MSKYQVGDCFKWGKHARQHVLIVEKILRDGRYKMEWRSRSGMIPAMHPPVLEEEDLDQMERTEDPKEEY